MARVRGRAWKHEGLLAVPRGGDEPWTEIGGVARCRRDTSRSPMSQSYSSHTLDRGCQVVDLTPDSG
jgi:hypothetical protein